MTAALFPDNYACPGGCGGGGYLLEDEKDPGSGFMVACEVCNEGATPIYDPEYAQIPF